MYWEYWHYEIKKTQKTHEQRIRNYTRSKIRYYGTSRQEVGLKKDKKWIEHKNTRSGLNTRR